MENIYPPSRFKATEHINLDEHFQEFLNTISEISSLNLFDDGKGEKKKNSNVELLESACNIDLLTCDGEIKKKPLTLPKKYAFRSCILEDLPFEKKTIDLEVLKTKQALEKNRSSEELLTKNRDNIHHLIIDNFDNKVIPKTLKPCQDFIMNVYVYKPFKYNFLEKNYPDKFRFSQDIQMLGSNYLTQLRDVISCPSDLGLQKEVQTTKENISHLTKAKETYPSGCFFIDDVFYNDFRSPEATDYSEEIIKWGKSRNVGNFISSDMSLTKLVDLSPRFGYPYLYKHQGDCEHIIIFADAHVLTENDCLNSLKYPRIYTINRMLSTICFMCNLHKANWLIKDYERLPESITYLCTKCTNSYCYIGNKKIGEFKLYPIFDEIIGYDNDDIKI